MDDTNLVNGYTTQRKRRDTVFMSETEVLQTFQVMQEEEMLSKRVQMDSTIHTAPTYKEAALRTEEQSPMEEVRIQRIIPAAAAAGEDMDQTDRLQKMSWKEKRAAKKKENARLKEIKKKEIISSKLEQKAAGYVQAVKAPMEYPESFDEKLEYIKGEFQQYLEFELSGLSIGSDEKFIKNYLKLRTFIDKSKEIEQLRRTEEKVVFHVEKHIFDKVDAMIHFGYALESYADAKYAILTDPVYLNHTDKEIGEMVSGPEKEAFLEKRSRLQSLKEFGVDEKITYTKFYRQYSETIIQDNLRKKEQLLNRERMIESTFGYSAFLGVNTTQSREIEYTGPVAVKAFDRPATRLSFLRGIYASRTGYRFFEPTGEEQRQNMKVFTRGVFEEFTTADFEKKCQLIAEMGNGLLHQKVRRDLNPASPDFFRNIAEVNELKSVFTDFDQALTPENMERVKELMGEENFYQVCEKYALLNDTGCAVQNLNNYFHEEQFTTFGIDGASLYYKNYRVFMDYLTSADAGHVFLDSDTEIMDYQKEIGAMDYMQYCMEGYSPEVYEFMKMRYRAMLGTLLRREVPN